MCTDAIRATISRVSSCLWVYGEIENPANSEIRADIRFFSTKGMKTVEIHRQICSMVSVWAKHYKH